MLISTELVEVKPLGSPSGIIHYMDVIYGKSEFELRIEQLEDLQRKINRIKNDN